MTQLVEPGSLIMTPAQAIVHDSMLRFLRIGSKQEATLEGYAGVGKSFVITRLLETLMEEDPWTRVAVTATTNKALQVLMKNSQFPTVAYLTVHQLLALKEVTDWQTGKKSFVRNTFRDAPIDSIQYVLVDEASQLHSYVYGLLKAELNRRKNLKILYIGDPFQIPPVNDVDERGRRQDSIPMYKWRELGFEHFMLDEVVRQAADNPIIQYATAIRKGKYYKWPNQITLGQPGPMQDKLTEFFVNEEFKNDPDYSKVVTYRNDTVDYMNKWIRETLYGKDLPQLVIGERLVAANPVIEGDAVLIRNSQEMRVLEYTPAIYATEWKKRTYKFNYYITKVELEEIAGPRITTIRILDCADSDKHEDLTKDMARTANYTRDKDKKKAVWSVYWRTVRTFADVIYNYCLTAHKAQGSTYRNCISLEWDINTQRDIRERERIKYVSTTRPSHVLWTC
jgi:exodeoxyribonuclease-5